MEELENNPVTSAEDLLGPPKIDLAAVGLSTLASLVSGFIGGLAILVSIVLFLQTVKLGAPGIFPYVMALVAFFAILVSTYLSLTLNNLIFPDKYRKGLATFAQTFSFSILLFVLVVPLYVYVGIYYPGKVIFVFTFHVLLGTFGVSLISEILSNYRYAILSVYSAFTGFFVASTASVAFFKDSLDSGNDSKWAFYSLVGAIVLITVLINFIRLLVEFAYYRFYVAVGSDPIGNVYEKIENEEREALEKAERELTRF